MSHPFLSVVVSSHDDSIQHLQLLLGCLELQAHYQTRQTLQGQTIDRVYDRPVEDIECEAIVINDGISTRKREWITNWEGSISVRYLEFPKVNESVQNPLDGSWGHWGHPLREHGIHAARGEWLLVTNDDNYYVPHFLARTHQEALKPRSQMVIFNTLSNLWGYQFHWPVSLEVGKIDLGSAIVRSEIAQEVGFPFRAHTGDFEYLAACAERIRNRGGIMRRIDDILFVHN